MFGFSETGYLWKKLVLLRCTGEHVKNIEKSVDETVLLCYNEFVREYHEDSLVYNDSENGVEKKDAILGTETSN